MSETIRQLAPKIAMQMGTPTTPVFEFSACNHRPPLFFFNGNLVSGHAGMRRMVELFADYPIISINPHGLHGEPIPASIEQMAADRLPHILERQTSGPFLLGGKCNGAMAAFEVARLLMAAGHKVDMVAMVDPPTVAARPAPRALLGLLKPMVSPYLLSWTHQQMAQLERYLKKSTSGQIAIAESEISRPLWDAYSIAMAQYLPAPLEVPVAFYAADHDGRAWRHLSSQLEVIQVPGGHDGCLTIGAELLVRHLRRRVDSLADRAASVELNKSPLPSHGAQMGGRLLGGET
jgi:thioesterase domain-containing protein